MSDKKVDTTAEDTKKSLISLYSNLLKERETKKEIKEAEKQKKKEEKILKKEEKKLNKEQSEDKPMTKAEKREANFNSWKEIVIGLTGDDLDYSPKKKNKKKYKKWIDTETGENVVLTSKPHKKKKQNFHKEFEPEMNMLKSIVAEQNKFTADLQRRYQNSAGPNTKDAMPLTKNLVELAAVINTSRGNSLSLVKEIGMIKKTIADLYMKQHKIDSESNSEGFGGQDVALMGSSIAQSMFGNAVASRSVGSIDDGNANAPSSVSIGTPNPANMGGLGATQSMPAQESIAKPFDPESWDGGGLKLGSTEFEAIPHDIIVELHKDENKARFKAVRKDDGTELVGCPVPTCTIKAIDEKNKIAKDDFDQVYQVSIV